MDRKIITGVIVLGILILGAYLFSSTGAVVSARGESLIEVQPDRVSVNINIDVKNNTAQEAQETVKQISDKTVKNLVAAGILEEDIELAGYNIYSDYEYTPQGGSKQKGFRGSQQIIVKVSDFAKISDVVDSAINSGSLVSYINFDLSDSKQNEYKTKALTDAGKDAKKKAEATAAGIGKNIGRLVSIENTEFNYGGPWAYYEKSASLDSVAGAGTEAREAAMNIKPRTTEVRASVSVVYRLSRF